MKTKTNRIFSALLAFVMVLSMVPTMAFAAESSSVAYAAENTATAAQYYSISDAVAAAAPGQIVKIMADAQDVVYNNEGVILDLNGHKVTVSTPEDVTVSAIDSATDDYKGEYGSLTTDGNVATTVKTTGDVKSYVSINDNGSWSFHRYYAAITAISLKPGSAALGYKAEFYGDEAVKNAVVNYGYEMWLNDYAPKTLSKADKLEKSVLTLRLNNILKEGNDALNAIGSTASINGKAFITLNLNGEEVTLYSADQTTTLRKTIESINANVAAYSETALQAVRDLCTLYAPWMKGWATENIFGVSEGEGDLDVEVLVPVTAENNVVTAETVVEKNNIVVTIPAGVQLADGADNLVLTIIDKASSDSDVEAAEDEALRPLDVHIEGISAENTTPIIICLGNVLPKGLNIGNYELYHVEDGSTVAMTMVNGISELDAHNEFCYDPATGAVTVAVCSFSEITLTSRTSNPWNGKTDITWYSAEKAAYELHNADQLAGLGELVDGGNTFEGKTVTLIGDIDLYGVNDQGNRYNFNPIGFSYSFEGGQVFKGTFDGNGNTISNLYQNCWDLGADVYTYSMAGGGLFASIEDATIKNLTMDGASIVLECIDMGAVVGYANGNCHFENIIVRNSSIQNYNRYTGGVIGEVGGGGTYTLKNVDVEASTILSALWGTFDPSVGGIIGGVWHEAGSRFSDGRGTELSIQMVNCDVAAELDVYNDVTSAYQWYSYRRCGMLIGYTEESETVNGRTSATASFLTTENCTVSYGDWVDYHYCEFNNAENENNRYPWVRVEAGLSNSAFSNPRYGHPDDITDTPVTTIDHKHQEGDQHNMLATFHQLYGGGQGCYGGNNHVTKNLGVKEINAPAAAEKFNAKVSSGHTIIAGTTVTLGQLFQASGLADIQNLDVHAYVSPVNASASVRATFTKDNGDWTNSKLSFSGSGMAEITITDYYYCTATTLNVMVASKVESLQSSGNGWGTDGIYATASENDAYYVQDDWGIEYTPVNADVSKLVRGGVEQSVGMPGEGTLIKFTSTDYYLKTAAHTISGEVLPLQDQDYLIVEGCFQHTATGSVLYINKTYIYNNNGTLEFSTTKPILPVSYDLGVLQAHAANAGASGIYFSVAESNDAPWGDWNTYYDAQSADSVKLIRNGETVSIALVDKNNICKFGANDYYLRLENYTIGDYAPITTDDVFIVEGAFTHKNSKTTLNIAKTYIFHNGVAWVFSTSLPTVYNAGVLQTHEVGMDGNGLYFRTEACDAPSNTDWSLEYMQTSADNIKLIRNGETISVGIAGRPMFVRINEIDHYLKLESWTIGSYAPITTEDVLIIEGDFYYGAENVFLNITKSYIYYDDDAWVCSADDPNMIHQVGTLSSHPSGGIATAFYALGAENGAPYAWAAEYAPTSADCVKLIRNGVTYATAPVGAGTVVKFDTNGYFVKFESWMNGNYPLQAGDMIIIEGIFVGTSNYAEAEGVKIEIDKTYVVYDGSRFTFSAEDPRIIHVGAMHPQGGADWTGNEGINFTVDANNAPYNADWSVEYVPTSNANIKLIRNGQTLNIANTGAGTIVKLSESNCYLKLEQWMIGDIYPITEGDVLVVEGQFKQANGDYSMMIDKTYIIIGDVANDEVTFTTQYALTDFGAVILPTANDTLNIGVWNGSCHAFEDKQLQELKAAGITKIMGVNTQWIGTEDVNAWLDRVYSYGIRVIMDLRDWDGTTVPSYANHPGLMGFLMYDEPSANEFQQLAELKAKFDAVMPAGKLFYVNLFPECAANSSLGTEANWWESIFGDEKDYHADYVTAFLNALNIEVLSWDNYSLLNGNGIRIEYFHNFEVMASKNKTMWYTMLSAGHPTTAGNTYATPTAEELRWQMAVALTYGVRNIDHYTYASHEDGYSCMVEYDTWNPTDLYYDIKAVDNEYLAWGNIFMAYDWQGVGVYDTGAANTMLTVLENKLNLANYGLTVNSSNEDLLVGVFDHNGDKAYMVTNAGSAGNTTVGDGKSFTTADATVTLSLGSGSYKCAAVIDNGEISYVAVNADNTVTLNVQAYEGVFVIPVLN